MEPGCRGGGVRAWPRLLQLRGRTVEASLPRRRRGLSSATRRGPGTAGRRGAVSPAAVFRCRRRRRASEVSVAPGALLGAGARARGWPTLSPAYGRVSRASGTLAHGWESAWGERCLGHAGPSSTSGATRLGPAGTTAPAPRTPDPGHPRCAAPDPARPSVAAT